MTDLVIVGAGVIGLSTAYEAATRGAKVTIIDIAQPGKQASWAGAGILTPTNEHTALHPLEKLRGISSRLHEQWAVRLLSETGIDNGYSKCGGLYLARSSGEVAALNGIVDEWRDYEIEFCEISHDELFRRVRPCANLPAETMPKRVFWTPDEAQVENPAHLKSLQKGCRNLGVEFVVEAEFVTIDSTGTKVRTVTAGEHKIEGQTFCFCAGPWTQELLASQNILLPMVPVRGQMLLFKLEQQLFEPIIYEGSRYIVPRRDGHVLVGATIEEVGFDKTTTEPAIEELKCFANSLIPELCPRTFVKAWAGLRPGTYDGFPYMGRLAELENGFVSTGHFKSGLHLSTGSASVINDLFEGKQPEIEMSPFQPNRLRLPANSDR